MILQTTALTITPRGHLFPIYCSFILSFLCKLSTSLSSSPSPLILLICQSIAPDIFSYILYLFPLFYFLSPQFSMLPFRCKYFTIIQLPSLVSLLAFLSGNEIVRFFFLSLWVLLGRSRVSRHQNWVQGNEQKMKEK